MGNSVYPDKYLLFNEQQSKALNIVVTIEGVSDVFSLFPSYTRVRYGDPGVVYGEPGLVYGGLRRIPGNRTYLSMESAIAITQRLEPEQGKASNSSLSLQFIDKDGYMSRLISPGGGILNEILGSKKVRIYLGFQKTSYPEDYFTVFRGLITGVVSQAGKVTLKLSDSNQRRRSKVFEPATTKTTALINSSVTTLPVLSTSGFYSHILGPNGGYDSSAKTWVKVGEEFMEYGAGALTGSTVSPVTRGSRGSTAASHAADSDVAHCLELTDHAITLALKVMLSGWNGPWITGVPVTATGASTDPAILGTQYIVLPPLTDADADYGLTVGDYGTISGGPNNGVNFIVAGFLDLFGSPNRIIMTDVALALDLSSSATLSFRSKYDTLPTGAGLKMDPTEIDVKTHELLRSKYFSGTENTLRIFLTDAESGKDFIEKEFYLPISAYSLTRYGRLSVGYTRPPLPGDRLVFLDASNVKEPQNISITRDLNVRTFFNKIAYEYDAADDGTFQSVRYTLDTKSISRDEGLDLVSTLTIRARGVQSDLNGGLLAQRRSNNLLSRYKNVAYDVALKCFWKVASVIESGDVVVLTDDGNLKITNFETGERDLGQQLFEVVDRKLNLTTGDGELKLRSGLGNTLSDRYGTISPSSKIIGAQSTTTRLRVKESFGGVFPGKEYLKWVDYVGLNLRVHNRTFSRSAEVVLQALDTSDPFTLILASPLPFAPQENDRVDLAPYPDTTDPLEQKLSKLLHAFWSPTLTVVTGISDTQFTVSAGDAMLVQAGQPILVHDYGYSVASPERTVESIVGVTVTVASSLGFTPSAGQRVDYVGFKDGGGAYRWL